MPDWSTSPMPTEPKKHGSLHERSSIPRGPRTAFASYRGLLLGLAFTLGYIALAYQTRASWETHRDWVVPMTVPLWAIGGACLGHLVDRGRWRAIIPGAGPLLIGLVLTGLNIWRGAITEGQDNLRDVMTVGAAVAFSASLLAFLAGAAWVEITHPTKAPTPEA